MGILFPNVCELIQAKAGIKDLKTANKFLIKEARWHFLVTNWATFLDNVDRPTGTMLTGDFTLLSLMLKMLSLIFSNILNTPKFPNTSNRIEGSINSFLQRKLDTHRGLNLNGQRQLISAFLCSKQ
jgi:hypothetical protein